MPDEFWLYLLAGFCAQLVDGTLGMAYGLSATSLLLALGVTPAQASATVHAAEMFTTGASGIAHRHFGNVDRALFRRLVLPAIAGAVLGALLLSAFPGHALRPVIAVYLLLMGAVVIVKAFRAKRAVDVRHNVGRLGFVGAFVDAVGGGGWGPIVASTLIARGGETRRVVGTVNATEFFVTVAASATFVLTLQWDYWTIVLALALGGVIAAPFGAYLCKRLPTRPLMVLIGLVVMGLSLYNLLR